MVIPAGWTLVLHIRVKAANVLFHCSRAAAMVMEANPIADNRADGK